MHLRRMAYLKRNRDFVAGFITCTGNLLTFENWAWPERSPTPRHMLSPYPSVALFKNFSRSPWDIAAQAIDGSLKDIRSDSRKRLPRSSKTGCFSEEAIAIMTWTLSFCGINRCTTIMFAWHCAWFFPKSSMQQLTSNHCTAILQISSPRGPFIPTIGSPELPMKLISVAPVQSRWWQDGRVV